VATVHESTPRGVSRTSALALTVLFVVTMVLVAWGFRSHDGWLPSLASSHGASIDAVIHYLLGATGILFVAGHLVLAGFVWKYSSPERRDSTEVSSKVEWRWALVPVLLMCVVAEGGVLIVGMPAFTEMYGDAPEDALTIEVVGKQFEWLVHYPGPDGVLGACLPEKVNDSRNPIGLDKKDPASKDDIVTRGRLNLPVDRTVVLRLRALDVIHSFTVPNFRVKQDLIPGFWGRTQFRPTVTGKYELACAELCGLGHFRMQGTVTVQTPEEFETFLSEEEPWF
jgi:cytochrome c oxidase subunit 2